MSRLKPRPTNHCAQTKALALRLEEEKDNAETQRALRCAESARRLHKHRGYLPSASTRFCVSAESARLKTVCFHTHLQVRNLKGLRWPHPLKRLAIRRGKKEVHSRQLKVESKKQQMRERLRIVPVRPWFSTMLRMVATRGFYAVQSRQSKKRSNRS
jgi:hypothetical protein